MGTNGHHKPATATEIRPPVEKGKTPRSVEIASRGPATPRRVRATAMASWTDYMKGDIPGVAVDRLVDVLGRVHQGILIGEALGHDTVGLYDEGDEESDALPEAPEPEPGCERCRR